MISFPYLNFWRRGKIKDDTYPRTKKYADKSRHYTSKLEDKARSEGISMLTLPHNVLTTPLFNISIPKIDCFFKNYL